MVAEQRTECGRANIKPVCSEPRNVVDRPSFVAWEVFRFAWFEHCEPFIIRPELIVVNVRTAENKGETSRVLIIFSVRES